MWLCVIESVGGAGYWCWSAGRMAETQLLLLTDRQFCTYNQAATHLFPVGLEVGLSHKRLQKGGSGDGRLDCDKRTLPATDRITQRQPSRSRPQVHGEHDPAVPTLLHSGHFHLFSVSWTIMCLFSLAVSVKA